jgi:hypothetical protein
MTPILQKYYIPVSKKIKPVILFFKQRIIAW